MSIFHGLIVIVSHESVDKNLRPLADEPLTVMAEMVVSKMDTVRQFVDVS